MEPRNWLFEPAPGLKPLLLCVLCPCWLELIAEAQAHGRSLYSRAYGNLKTEPPFTLDVASATDGSAPLIELNPIAAAGFFDPVALDALRPMIEVALRDI